MRPSTTFFANRAAKFGQDAIHAIVMADVHALFDRAEMALDSTEAAYKAAREAGYYARLSLRNEEK